VIWASAPVRKATRKGGLFRFVLDHGPMLRSIGCPVIRVDGELLPSLVVHVGLKGSETGFRPLQEGRKLVFVLFLQLGPKQLCPSSNRSFSRIFTVSGKPIVHRLLYVRLLVRLEVSVEHLDCD
jgi:hypothetical protein